MSGYYHYLWFTKEKQAEIALDGLKGKIVKNGEDDAWLEASENYEFELGIQFLTDEKLTPEQLEIINGLDPAKMELDNPDD